MSSTVAMRAGLPPQIDEKKSPLSLPVYKAKPKVIFAVTGGMHPDLAPIQAETMLVTTANDKGIRVIFSDELPNVSLEVEMKLNQHTLAEVEPLLKKIGLPNLFKDSLFVNLDDYEKIFDAIKKNTPPGKNQDLLARADFQKIVQYSARKELVKFYQLLKKRSIPFVGIDPSVVLGIMDEQIRTSIVMVNAILKHGLSKLSGESGIIIVNCGTVHVHRIAANLRLSLEKNKALTDQYDFDIVPMRVFSPRFAEEIAINEEEDAIRNIPQDSPEVINAYSLMPCHKIEFKEDSPGCFSSLQFEKMLYDMTHTPGEGRALFGLGLFERLTDPTISKEMQKQFEDLRTQTTPKPTA